MLPKLLNLHKRRDEIVEDNNCSPIKADLRHRIDKWDKNTFSSRRKLRRRAVRRRWARLYTPLKVASGPS